MSEILASVMGMSIAGGAAVLFVMLIRLLFRPSGRVCSAMWLLAGLRLLLPFSVADALGLSLPEIDLSRESSAVYELAAPDVIALPTQAADSSAYAPAAAEVTMNETAGVVPAVSADRVIAALWLAGAAVVAICVAVGYIRLRMRLRTAVRVETDVYQSERIPAPFVFGLVRPRIYIPYSVDDGDIPYVLKHERNHIKRNDHITKAAALAVLAVHWFNPLVWAAYLLFCRDVETACDEKVIAHMDLSDRRYYSAALLACSVGGRVAGCPVAFGEVGVKERIRHIMKYTKPAFMRNLLSAVLCVALMLCAFALPVGCAEASAAPGPTVYEPVDTEAPDYEGTDRVVNEDGSVTMIFIPNSTAGSDTIQFFRYSGECDSVQAGTTSGFVTSPSENDRIVYITAEDGINGEVSSAYLSVVDEEGYLAIEEQGDTLSVDGSKSVVWIPEEINFGDADGKMNAVITFVFSCEDGTQDTATITIAVDENASAPEGMTVLNISADEGHTLTVDGDDIVRTIVITKAE